MSLYATPLTVGLATSQLPHASAHCRALAPHSACPSRLTTPPTYAASCGARAPPDPRPHDRFLACSVVTVYRGALVATSRPVRRRGIAPCEMFSRMTFWEFPNVIPCKNLKISKSSFLPRRGRNFGITDRCGMRQYAAVCAKNNEIAIDSTRLIIQSHSVPIVTAQKLNLEKHCRIL